MWDAIRAIRSLALIFAYKLAKVTSCVVAFAYVLWLTRSGPESAQVVDAAFAVMAALAALAFTWAQVLEKGDPVRGLAVASGERLSLSAVAFIVGSVMRFAGASPELGIPSLASILTSMAVVASAAALTSGLWGMNGLVDALVVRVSPHIAAEIVDPRQFAPPPGRE